MIYKLFILALLLVNGFVQGAACSSKDTSKRLSDPAATVDLQFALLNGDSESLETALKANADPNNDDPRFALHAAICNLNGQSERLVELLLKAGADRLHRGLENEMPIHFAVTENSLKVIELLLEVDREKQLNAQDDLGRTPMHCAIEQPAVIAYLLEQGANPSMLSSAKKDVLAEAQSRKEELEDRLKIDVGDQQFTAKIQAVNKTIAIMTSFLASKKKFLLALSVLESIKYLPYNILELISLY